MFNWYVRIQIYIPQDLSYSVDTCPLPESPDGGSVEVETMGAVTSAYYTCEAGYALYGDSERLCLEDNSWEGQAPTCSKR